MGCMRLVTLVITLYTCMYRLCDVTMTTRQKMPSLLLNSTEQCFAAHVVHTCQQY